MTTPWTRPDDWDRPGLPPRGGDSRAILDQLDFLSQGVPAGAVYKSVGTSINSGSGGTTYTNDPHIQFEVEANEVVRLMLEAVYDAGTAEDFKARWLLPSGQIEAITFAYSTTAPAPLAAGSGEVVGLPGAGVGTLVHYRFTGSLFVGATGGTVNWQWAQTTSGANNTTVAKGSTLMFWRMA